VIPVRDPGPAAVDGDRRRNLRLISADGIAFSAMVGLGEHYIAAFVLALGLGELVAGLAAVLPLLAGGVIQLVTPWGVRRLGSRRRWVAGCAAVQACAFIPLIAGAAAGRLPVWAVFAAASLYWAAGMAAGSPWNVWVERLVPRAIRSRYFARRTGVVHLGVLVSLLLGGLVLDTAKAADRTLLGFGLLFAAAMSARFVSSRILAATSEPADALGGSLREQPRLPLPRRLPRGNDARLLVYALALIASTTVAGPYFSPYMLRQLELSYSGYTTLIGIALLARVLVMPLLARGASRWGLVALLRTAWGGIAVIPALWLLSGDYLYLCALQAMSGVVWAMHEYSLFLLIFETVEADRRVRVLTAYNLADATVKVGGAMAGALIFSTGGGPGPGYVALFLASSVLRFGCLALLVRVRASRMPAPLHLPRPQFRPLAVRPGQGAWHLPVFLTRRRRFGRDREDEPEE
jgi:MFS family permease